MDEQLFVRNLMGIGIVSYREQQTLWDVTKRCMRIGVPMAGAGAVLGLKAGTFTVPGIGTVSGAVVGALVGFATGTAACVVLNETYRDELRKLANQQ